jgi:hypothetical protein
MTTSKQGAERRALSESVLVPGHGVGEAVRSLLTRRNRSAERRRRRAAKTPPLQQP